MIVLGSTGSIGVNALKIAKLFNIEIEALCAGYNIELLNKQIRIHNPKIVVIADKNDKGKITKEFNGRLYFGIDGVLECLAISSSSLVINAFVGTLGLLPTIESMRQNKILALANKESLVIGGAFLDTSRIIPIDSEHFSIAYLLNNQLIQERKKFKKLYITASGGAFRDAPLNEICGKKAIHALKHPNWKMGQKITIDSATMMNKLFEILEAYWLFNSKNLDAYIERNSHIHALVEFWDGSVVAHFAKANMQFPIAYAMAKALKLSEDELSSFSNHSFVDSIDLLNVNYKLESIDTNRYKVWGFKELMLDNPKLGVVLNAANEVAVKAFLQDIIPFGQMYNIVSSALDRFCDVKPSSIEEVLLINDEVESFVRGLIV